MKRSPLKRKTRLRQRSPRTQDIRDKDAEWSRAVIERAKGRCERSGERGTDAHHVIYRRHRATRWLLDNGVCLSRKEHRRAHDYPNEFMDWFKTNRRERWENIETAQASAT